MKKYLNDLSVLKHFLIYSCGSLFLKTISLIVVPLTLRKLAPSDYGILSLIMSFVCITTTIIELGLRQVVSLEYFHCKTSTEKKELIRSILALYIAAALPILSVLYIARTTIIHIVFFDSISSSSFLWMLLIIFISFFTNLFYQLLQYNQLVYLVTRIQVGATSLTSILTIFFIWGLDFNYEGIILAQLIGYCTSSAFTFIKCFDHDIIAIPNFKNMITNAKHYIPYGFPFIPRILFSWILLASDKWILAYYCSMQDVGIYAVADLFAQVLYSLIIIPWESAYVPYIMQQYIQNKQNINQTEQRNQQIMYIATGALFCIITLGFLIGKTFLSILIPPTYAKAINHILILSLGQVLLLASNFSSTIIQFYKRTYVLLFVLTVPAIANILLNLLLIPHYGVYGATSATFISFGLYWIITLYMNRQTRLMYWYTAPQALFAPPVSDQPNPLS